MTDRMNTALARPEAAGTEKLARVELTAPVRVNTEGIGLMTLCQSLAASGFFRDCRDASQAVVKVLYGQELGIAPVTAMMSIHIIEGKPAPSANLLAAMIKKARPLYDYRVAELSNARCELVFFERGEEVGRTTWTVEDARRAGLYDRKNRDGSPGNWQKYPRPMLFARAISEGVRTYCPDLFGGAPVYTPEELGAQVNPETGEVLNIGPVQASGNTADASDPMPTQQRVEAAVNRTQRPASTLVEGAASTPNAQCPDCHAPAGKPHAKSCPQNGGADLQPTPSGRTSQGEREHQNRRLFAVYAEACEAAGVKVEDSLMRTHCEKILSQLKGYSVTVTSRSNLSTEDLAALADHISRYGIPHERQSAPSGELEMGE